MTDAWVEVVVDRLNLRMDPGTEGESIGLLSVGAVGQIAGGPIEADGYTWYALAGPGLSYATGCELTPPPMITCPGFFGWVAAADLDGTPWLAVTEPQCPDQGLPTTIADLADIQPGLAFACFADDTFVLEGYIAPTQAGRGCYRPEAVTPDWLHPCAVQFLQGTATDIEADGPELAAHLHPSVGQCDFGGRSPPACPYLGYIGRWVEVEGHFDDPAAQTCAASSGPATPPGYQLPDSVEVVWSCRTSFVVSSIGPAD